jgi:hypothetical protein
MTGYENYIGSADPGVIQFENANEGRSYPFEDNSVLEADSGAVLPDEVVADMHLVIPRGSSARLSSVYISPYMVSLCVAVDGQRGAALSCMAKASEFRPYVPYRLEKLTGSEDVGGIVTFGQIDFQAAAGSYRFTARQIRVAECAVSRYTPAKLRRIVDPRTGDSVSGDVSIDFPSYVEASRSEEGVSLSLAEGANDILLPRCDRIAADNPCGATPVKSINGVRSDDKRRIVLWFH